MTDCMNGLLKKRRSIYNLGNKEVISDEAVAALVKEAVKNCPSAFNSQSARVLVLFGENHHRFWSFVYEILKKMVPAGKFQPTADKPGEQFYILKIWQLLRICSRVSRFIVIIFRAGPNRLRGCCSMWCGRLWPNKILGPACSIIIRWLMKR